MQATFAQLIAQGADAGQIADKAVSTWRIVDAALSPIIGEHAVAALYKRSVSLTRRDYPCLCVSNGDSPGDDFAVLRTVLSQQTSSKAVAAQNALLQTFRELLTNLLGESLTGRLLEAVCDTPSGAGELQDKSS